MKKWIQRQTGILKLDGKDVWCINGCKKGAEAVITRSLSPVSDNFQEREHSDMKKV